LTNFQARQLAVDVPVEEAWQGSWTGTLQELLDAAPNVDEAELIGRARERALERRTAIEFVGVTADLDGVLQRVAEFWGKPAPPALPRSNESLVTVAA